MMTFSYQARDGAGNIVNGIQDAINEDNAVTSLMSRGLMVLSLQQKAAASRAKNKVWTVKETDLVLFTRQLATMIEAGISLVQALTALYEQCEPKRQKSLRNVISDVTARVQGGDTFHESIAKHPRVFNRLFVSMVKAEEVDFGVGSSSGGDSDVRFTAILSDRMVVAFPAGHPLRQCKSVKLNQLVHVPLVLMTADSSVRKLVDAAFASIGQLIMPAYEATYMSTAAGMVKAGLGVTILPSSAIQMGELAGLVTRPISRPAITRELGIIEKSSRSLSPAAEGFLRTIKAAVSAA
jgi:DNA-binding transcriptional LysR family regulator